MSRISLGRAQALGWFAAALSLTGCGGGFKRVSTPPDVNTAPTACFDVIPLSGGKDLMFDAGCSSDAEDSAAQLQVRWDLDGNGTWDVDWSTRKDTSWNFGTNGVKTVKLEVKDSGGLTTGAFRRIAVPYDNVPWYDPIAPSAVLTDVRFTFCAKSVANYDRSLTDDFTFVPDPADNLFIEDPTFFDGWSKLREVHAFDSVFQQSQGTVAFTWGPPIPDLQTDPDSADLAFYQDLKYTMVFTRTDADTTISGKADLYLREGTAGWQIYKWVDKRDGADNATLGLVRWRGRVVY
jgi:hypothetical protein